MIKLALALVLTFGNIASALPQKYVLPHALLEYVNAGNWGMVLQNGEMVDVNGDGLVDLVYSIYSSGSQQYLLSVYINDPNQQMWVQSSCVTNIANACPAVGSVIDKPLDIKIHAPNSPVHDVLNLIETSEYLRLDKEIVLDLLLKGDIKGKQIGLEWRIHRSSLTLWLKGEI